MCHDWGPRLEKVDAPDGRRLDIKPKGGIQNTVRTTEKSSSTPRLILLLFIKPGLIASPIRSSFPRIPEVLSFTDCMRSRFVFYASARTDSKLGKYTSRNPTKFMVSPFETTLTTEEA